MTAAAISFARPQDAVHRVFDDRLGGDAGRNLDLCDLDELPFAGAAPMFERGEKRNPCVHPDDQVGWTLQIARRPVGIPRRGRHARRLLEVERPTDVVAPRALQPEPGHAHQDHVGPQIHQRFIIQPELLDHPGREVLHDDVGIADKSADQLTAAIGREIQCDVSLVEVGGLPHRAALVPPFDARRAVGSTPLSRCRHRTHRGSRSGGRLPRMC
jgi:hypothetical protein